MPTISLTLPVAGTVAQAGLVASDFTSIQNLLNGGLDTANWAFGKIFAPSKIMQESAVDGDGLAWDNSASIWKRTSDKQIRQAGIAFDAWQAYTPAWTSTGTAPSLGNGTITGRYTQIGKTVFGSAVLTMGSTTTFGTGTYRLSLPVNIQAGGGVIGSVQIHDVSPAADYLHHCFPDTATTFILYSAAAPAVAATNTAPITFANGDSITARFFYEAA
jgi:hypothetical protein